MNISKHERHTACTEAPNLQPSTFCSTETQDLGHWNTIYEQETLCVQPCLVRVSGQVTRSEGQRAEVTHTYVGRGTRRFAGTRTDARRRQHGSSRPEVCNGARSCLLSCCWARQEAGGQKTRRESRIYRRRPQRGEAEAEAEAREEEETSGIRSKNLRLRRRCVRVAGAGDSTWTPSSWNLDACVAAWSVSSVARVFANHTRGGPQPRPPSTSGLCFSCTRSISALCFLTAIVLIARRPNEAPGK
jgi:hypothetical protein